ncbi:MAG: hypothetical protein OSJ28_01975 [Desulfovibrio sp.]|jgi:predicted small lipoprotein YifL|nr:hypothetical protein [Desulfovibrio sp.]
MRKIVLALLAVFILASLSGCGIFFDEPNYGPDQHAYGQGRAF